MDNLSAVLLWENESGIQSRYTAENARKLPFLGYTALMFTFLDLMFKCPSDMTFLQLTLLKSPGHKSSKAIERYQAPGIGMQR